MENKTISRNIKIHPSNLTNNIKNHIMTELKKLYENKCILNVGYITEILKIEKIKSSVISRANSEIILNISFNINCVEPKIDSVLNVKVCHVIEEHGILCRINNIRIIIPSNTLTSNNFTFNKNCFNNQCRSIKLDDFINVKIKGVKYNKDIYNCFGQLV